MDGKAENRCSHRCTPVRPRAFVCLSCLLAVVLLLLPLTSVQALDEPSLQISIKGLDNKTTRQLRKILSLNRLAKKQTFTDLQVRQAYQKADGEIQRFMNSRGYYEASIRATLRKVNATWRVHFLIAPGAPVMISEVSVSARGEGEDFPTIRDYVENFPLQPGQVFNHKKYEDARQQLLNQALQQGFLDATLSRHVVELSRRKHRAVIRLQLDTGPRYYFGPVRVVQDRLQTALLAPFITLREGQPYTTAAILEQQDVLARSDYFSEIYVQPLREQARGTAVPVEIRPILRKPNRYSLGIGYSTDTGIRGSIGWERRPLNRKGHSVSVNGLLSRVIASGGMRYRIPIRDPREDELAITALLTREQVDDRISQVGRLGVARVIMRGQWRETLALNLEAELFSAGVQDDVASRLLLPSVDWTRITPRRQMYVTRGHRASFLLQGSSTALFSSARFAQARLASKWIFPLGTNGRLLTRGEAGLTHVASIYDLPGSFRFYAGGDQSIRGYSYASLGPVDVNGEVAGGKYLLVGSAEYEHKLGGNWSLATFYDAGNAFNNLDTARVAMGAGLGVRWRSPIGQIRLDFAAGINDPDNNWRVHLYMGPDL